jgi:hypothetical protein
MVAVMRTALRTALDKIDYCEGSLHMGLASGPLPGDASAMIRQRQELMGRAWVKCMAFAVDKMVAGTETRP